MSFNISINKDALISCLIYGLFLCAAPSASAAVLFQDDFNAGANLGWGEESGSWTDTGGVYTSSSGWSYSSAPTGILTDFSIQVDINNFWNGAIFLRSDFNNGANNGIMLVTGGRGGGGNGIYWHTFQNGVFTPIANSSGYLFPSASSFQLRIDVIGDTYSAYINGSATPATTYTSSVFSSGNVALQNNGGPQSFDNVVISSVPLPASFWLLFSGLVGLMALVRKRNCL